MKTKLISLVLLITLFNACDSKKEQSNTVTEKPENALVGKWYRVGPMGPVSFDFKNNGMVEGDFGDDASIDVVAKYELSGDTIKIIDKEIQMCKDTGLYLIHQTDDYVSFDLISDECGGRIKMMMGFWTKPEFKELILEIENELASSPKPELYLTRGRVYLAAGLPQKARVDFDMYLLSDTTDATVYLNRAGTKFPADIEGVVVDCNKSIAIDPNNKNAYFLRGLARYELGEKEKGCEDFAKAIELGFSVLRIAEQEKCVDYWDE